MKTKFIALALCILPCLNACTDYLDKTPDEDMTIEQVFTNPDWTRAYLSNIYSWLPNEANFADDGAFRSPFTGGCDEMEIAFGGAFSHMINAGSWNSSNIDRIPVWREAYAAIRCANIFLAHIDRANATPDQIKVWKGEAYFLRAYFHFQVMRAYGPAILVDRVIAPDEIASDLVRSTIDATAKFIADDCGRAFNGLPETWTSTDYGRPTQTSALALKSRVLLYLASPLYNGNTDLAMMKDPVTGQQLIPQQENPEKWKDAADAAEDCLEAAKAAGFKLHYSSSNDPVKNYEEVFTENWNEEILFGKNLGDYWHHMWCSDPISYGTPSIFNPTQELVDAYEMEDGSTPITGYTNNGLKPIVNAASGYIEEGYTNKAEDGRWPSGVRNMYVGREPRFYASINFPGQIWKQNHELAFWYEGVDGKKYAGSDYCKTGYLMRKINNIDITSNPLKTEKTFWIYFRLGEIYLNYAEALNEYSGPVDAVYDAVYEVRKRAGLPRLPEGLSKEQMRERIKHERRIELAFETHRFFDLRRWKDAEKSEGKPIHSLNIYAGTSRQDNAFYERTLCEQRVFVAPQHYFFPIEQAEIDKNRDRLLQNPGW